MINRVQELENSIKKYAESYYSGTAEISDEHFDELVDELRELNPNSEILKTPGWGYAPDNSSKKDTHKYGMLVGSLKKIKEITSIPKEFSPTKTRISAKLDGLSVVSYYDHGRRYLALTRGNGSEGKIVTDKINAISPETVEISDDFTGAIRGEVLIDCETWNSIKNNYKDNPSANPRNIAAGILNRNEIDSEIKYLRYVVYKVVADPEKKFGTVDGSLRFKGMSEFLYYNFKKDFVPEVSPFDVTYYTQQYLEYLYDFFKQTYPCDGVVFTMREIDYSDQGEILYKEFAYKFKAESEIVTVTNVDWNAGRTGRIIPRIWFNPVSLSGAEVQKCTGHNAAFIRDNKINVGTVIEVTRSNEVIPYMMGVINNPNTEGLLPTTCPNCGAVLEWDGDNLVCPYENQEQLIYRFISTVTDGIEGAGWKLRSRIIEVLGLNDESSFLNFLETIQSEDGRNEIVKSLYEGISGSVTQEKSKQIINKLSEEIDPCVFLVACNISGLSWTSAEALLQNYPEFLEDVKNSSINYDRIREISGFGSSFVNSIRTFSERILKILTRVRIAQVKIEEKKEYQFSVAITGALSMKRSDFEEVLKSYGVTTSSNFKEIKYLITNTPDSTSSKMKKAQKYGVKIISEQEILELLKK